LALGRSATWQKQNHINSCKVRYKQGPYMGNWDATVRAEISHGIVELVGTLEPEEDSIPI
jgi:hypothetical protein